MTPTVIITGIIWQPGGRAAAAEAAMVRVAEQWERCRDAAQ